DHGVGVADLSGGRREGSGHPDTHLSRLPELSLGLEDEVRHGPNDGLVVVRRGLTAATQEDLPSGVDRYDLDLGPPQVDTETKHAFPIPRLLLSRIGPRMLTACQRLSRMPRYRRWRVRYGA